jgi:hypothetical protein
MNIQSQIPPTSCARVREPLGDLMDRGLREFCEAGSLYPFLGDGPADRWDPVVGYPVRSTYAGLQNAIRQPPADQWRARARRYFARIEQLAREGRIG